MREVAAIAFPALTFILGVGCVLLFRAWQHALNELDKAEEQITGLEATLCAVTGWKAPLDG